VTNPLEPFWTGRGGAILDGGLASELAARGVDLNDPLWSARALLAAPETIAAVHRDYLEAGADVISTATYQASILGLTLRGLSLGEAEDVLASGVMLARRERDLFWERLPAGRLGGRPLVAASIGSYGAFLADGSEYRGVYGISADALAAWHRPRLRILEAAGPDLVAFETMPSLLEVEALVRLLAETDGPAAWISFQARDAASLADGSSVESAVALVNRAPRVVAVGVNCVAPELIEPLLARCAAATAKPLVAYPNRGGTWDAASKRWLDGDAAISWERLAPSWRDAGARLIGGCCRTTPADIHAIAASLE